MDRHRLASIAVTMDLDQEKLQRVPGQVNEVIASFAETYARMAELQRVLERTCRRAEAALALAREIRRVRL
jgi:phage shock protein A